MVDKLQLQLSPLQACPPLLPLPPLPAAAHGGEWGAHAAPARRWAAVAVVRRCGGEQERCASVRHVKPCLSAAGMGDHTGPGARAFTQLPRRCTGRFSIHLNASNPTFFPLLAYGLEGLPRATLQCAGQPVKSHTHSHLKLLTTILALARRSRKRQTPRRLQFFSKAVSK